MLATVFYAQPVGQLVACIVSAVVTAALRRHLLGDASPTHCVDDCYTTIDRIWRWIVGFGAVPPIFAVILRFWIPESARWLLEVKKNPMGIEAADYTRQRFFEDPFEDGEDPDGDIELGAPQPSGAAGLKEIYSMTPASNSTVVNEDTREDAIQVIGEATFDSEKLRPPVTTKSQALSSGSSFQDDAAVNPSITQDSAVGVAKVNQPSRPSADTWKGFWRGFRIYLFIERELTMRRLWLALQLKDEHFFDGSWTDLAGTSWTWALLDFSFYMILVNSQKLISKIWATPEYVQIYDMLMQPSYRAIMSTSVGALIGGALFIATARYRWNIQFYGFLILAALFIVVRVCFITLLCGRYFAAIIVL
jgi:PHS family inorganic phosphate transporter-like MFS transporter